MPMSMAEDGAEREREKKESRAMSLRERVEKVDEKLFLFVSACLKF